MTLAVFEKDDFSRLSLDKRTEFTRKHRDRRASIGEMSAIEIIELLASDQKYFKDKTLIVDILMDCKPHYLNDTHFVNTIFWMSQVDTRLIRSITSHPRFWERYQNYEAFRTAMSSLCTYMMVPIEGIGINWDTVEVMTDGPYGMLNEFVRHFMTFINEDVIDNDIAVKFADKYIGDAMYSGSGNEFYLLGLSLSNLKAMCASPSFQRMLAKAYDILCGYEAGTNTGTKQSVIKFLLENKDKIIKVYRQSKLYR